MSHEAVAAAIRALLDSASVPLPSPLPLMFSEEWVTAVVPTEVEAIGHENAAAGIRRVCGWDF